MGNTFDLVCDDCKHRMWLQKKWWFLDQNEKDGVLRTNWDNEDHKAFSDVNNIGWGCVQNKLNMFPTIMRVAQFLFNHKGHKVRTVADGGEGVDEEESKRIDKEYKEVFLDGTDVK